MIIRTFVSMVSEEIFSFTIHPLLFFCFRWCCCNETKVDDGGPFIVSGHAWLVRFVVLWLLKALLVEVWYDNNFHSRMFHESDFSVFSFQSRRLTLPFFTKRAWNTVAIWKRLPSELGVLTASEYGTLTSGCCCQYSTTRMLISCRHYESSPASLVHLSCFALRLRL